MNHIDWLTHCKAWETSGLTQAAFCSQHNLSLHKFKDARSRFIQEEKVSRAYKKPSTDTKSSSTANFIPIVSQSANRQMVLELDLGNQLRLKVYHHDLA